MQCTVISEFFEIKDYLSNEQKTPRDFGTGHLLYQSEINLINIIHKHPDLKVSELSKKLGITRGAVTQIGNKLVERGFILRYAEESNKKEKYYKLTELGETVRNGYEKYHANANAEMCNFLCSLNDMEKTVLLNFFRKMKECIPISLFDCQCHNNTIGEDSANLLRKRQNCTLKKEG